VNETINADTDYLDKDGKAVFQATAEGDGTSLVTQDSIANYQLLIEKMAEYDLAAQNIGAVE
jgi:hypothetical protein